MFSSSMCLSGSDPPPAPSILKQVDWGLLKLIFLKAKLVEKKGKEVITAQKVNTLYKMLFPPEGKTRLGQKPEPSTGAIRGPA